MRLLTTLFTLALFGAATTASAAPVSDEMVKQISSNLRVVNDSIEVRKVKASPVDGLYEVEIDTGEVILTSATGEHFVLGNMFEIKGGHFVNLTEQRKKGFRADTLKTLDKGDLVTFSPEGEVKATIYAFTDVDCGYCQKLHQEMAEYNAQGIEVHYLAFPRAGIGSRTYNEMVSVWCADDPQQAMTLAKTGGRVEPKDCDNPVAKQYALGNQFGVTGTPALVLEDGSLMPGYVPAAKLAAMLTQM